MAELTLDEIKAALGNAYGVGDIADKPNKLSSYVPGTEIAPQELNIQDISNAISQAFSPDSAVEQQRPQGNKTLAQMLQKAFEIKQGFLPYVGSSAQTAAGVLSGITTPIVGGAYGIARSIPEAIQTGQAPQPIAQRYAEEFIQQHPGFRVTDPQAQTNLEAIQKGFEASKLPPILPEGLEMRYPKDAVMATKANLPKISIQRSGAETQLKNQFGQRIEPQMGQSGGAAATTHTAAVQQAIADAHPSLQAELSNRDPASFTPQDLKAIEIHNKFAKVDPDLEHPASIPTEGQALQDVAKLSDEYNDKALPGNEALREKFETRDPFLIKGFTNVKNEFAPNHSGVGQQGKANNFLEDVKTNYVDVDNANIKKAYGDLNDTNGNFVVDMQEAAKNALDKVAATKRTNRIPKELKDTLDAYADGTYQGSGTDFENLRTDIASDVRKAKKANDGTQVHILNLLRDAIEELPMKGPEAIAFKEKADYARSLFKRQKDLLDPESSTYNKAYAMAEDDNRTPTERLTLQHPAADKFFENFITGKQATPADLNRMIDLVGRDSPAHHELIAGIADHLQKKAGVVDGKGNISQKALNDELVKLGPRLDLIVGSEAANRLRTIGEVASLTEHVRNRGGGSANVSQTANTQAREAELKAQKDFAAGIVEAGANIATGGKSGIVASALAPMFKARQERQLAEAAEAARQQRLQKTLSRSAGINPKD